MVKRENESCKEDDESQNDQSGNVKKTRRVKSVQRKENEKEGIVTVKDCKEGSSSKRPFSKEEDTRMVEYIFKNVKISELCKHFPDRHYASVLSRVERLKKQTIEAVSR
ncbi:hypothetical protein IE53DRAFT_381185 [Violaceomyces palustris]|uniref:Uncharacterized protein n=1 Tax=Violaceomyces palustris TaxID=1673888 RepID=A0ACD0NS45_9BASI|nr:hypothetical protein IE53DRAFT_381185 [Violaceomyces palustris]